MPEKRKAIFERIKKRGTFSIRELVEELGFSKNVTRTHLLTLEEQGLIERVKPGTNERGRPPLIYRISPVGQNLFPKNDGEVLTSLVQFIEREDGDDLLRRFFVQLWASRQREYEEELASLKTPPERLSTRLTAMKKVLERGGFLPALIIDGEEVKGAVGSDCACKQVSLRECHCPFPAVVKATRLPCHLEREFIVGIIGAEPQGVRWATKEEPHCHYEFVLGV